MFPPFHPHIAYLSGNFIMKRAKNKIKIKSNLKWYLVERWLSGVSGCK